MSLGLTPEGMTNGSPITSDPGVFHLPLNQYPNFSEPPDTFPSHTPPSYPFGSGGLGPGPGPGFNILQESGQLHFGFPLPGQPPTSTRRRPRPRPPRIDLNALHKDESATTIKFLLSKDFWSTLPCLLSDEWSNCWIPEPVVKESGLATRRWWPRRALATPLGFITPHRGVYTYFELPEYPELGTFDVFVPVLEIEYSENLGVGFIFTNKLVNLLRSLATAPPNTSTFYCWSGETAGSALAPSPFSDNSHSQSNTLPACLPNTFLPHSGFACDPHGLHTLHHTPHPAPGPAGTAMMPQPRPADNRGEEEGRGAWWPQEDNHHAFDDF